MNPLHYPDQPQCKMLTEIGFPEQRWGRRMATVATLESGRSEVWYEPSVMEMFDVIPTSIKITPQHTCTFFMEGFIQGPGPYLVGYRKHRYGKDTSLPNALAYLIKWLVSEGYKFVDGKLVK